MKKKAFKAALPYTLPICVGFLFLGMSYGFMMRSNGLFFCISVVHELFYLRRIYGVCYGESTFISV